MVSIPLHQICLLKFVNEGDCSHIGGRAVWGNGRKNQMPHSHLVISTALGSVIAAACVFVFLHMMTGIGGEVENQFSLVTGNADIV